MVFARIEQKSAFSVASEEALNSTQVPPEFYVFQLANLSHRKHLVALEASSTSRIKVKAPNAIGRPGQSAAATHTLERITL